MTRSATFVLFSGDDYYPQGGWEDYRGVFDTLEAAQAAWTAREFGWAHVVDLEALKIVSRAERLGPWRDGAEYDD